MSKRNIIIGSVLAVVFTAAGITGFLLRREPNPDVKQVSANGVVYTFITPNGTSTITVETALNELVNGFKMMNCRLALMDQATATSSRSVPPECAQFLQR